MPLFEAQQARAATAAEAPARNWRVVLDLLRATDLDLFRKIIRKMLNYLCYIGVEEAQDILQGPVMDARLDADAGHDGINRPSRRPVPSQTAPDPERVLAVASAHLSDEAILSLLNEWVKDSRVSFLVDVLEDSSTSLGEIADAITRYKESQIHTANLSPSMVRALGVSLIRRFFSRRLDFIRLAKKHVSLDDFYDLSRHIVFPARSQGQLGGKSAGLFVAMQIIRSAAAERPELADVKVPRTWYLVSDGIKDFLRYNHLEGLNDHKYRDICQIRIEYPNLVALCKRSAFSPAMIRGLSLALDDLGEQPLVVRSSSLLEDSVGAAFSGKYKSLFIANQGSKHQRLEALCDAIAEVYASAFGPDPIQYRAERGLLDFQEEMGIMIQEVVGTRVGPYLLPAFAGVAFSHNEFRWSPRIRREDGLVRLVPGLGTRAVDRLGNDYPVLISPGQPGLRVSSTLEEVIRYAPRFVDAINLESNSLESVALADLLHRFGRDYPRARQVFSCLRGGLLQRCGGLVDFETEELFATFDGVLDDTPFLARMKGMLDVLEMSYGHPVDIEFADDGTDFYLLQCRPQSSARARERAEIPRDVPPEDVIFTANRYVSEGGVTNLTHVVYVDPAQYDALGQLADLKAVGRIVGRLNSLLPKRRFILIGPGRWGSRGDIKLGVNVTYSDISHTAGLIEVAARKGGYRPDPSFGTHFFQDLVEASIVYLPLYPDDPDVVFQHEFLLSAPSSLAALVPGAEHLADVVRVIDVPAVTSGKILRLVMDGTRGRAMAYLTESATAAPRQETATLPAPEALPTGGGEDWIWRHRMAETMARHLDPASFGVEGLYLFGSTQNATAGACSDIDLLVHFTGTPEQESRLTTWLDGWSRCLGEINFLRTGYRTGPLLDVHLVTDADIANRTSWAIKIGAVSDAAMPLPLRKPPR